MHLRRRSRSPRPIRFLAEGDSITAAITAPDSYSRLWAAEHATINYTNTAVGGGVLGSVGDTSPTNSLYARQAADLAWAPTHMSVFIGANDVNNTTVTATYLANLYNYLAPFKASGTKIAVCTVLPRSGVTGQETARAAVNTQLRADVSKQFDYLVDFDTTSLGVAAATSDTTLYSDGLHPTALGHSILKRVYATVVNWMLGIANDPVGLAFAPQAAATLDTDYDSPAITITDLAPGETRPYGVTPGQKIKKNTGSFVTNGAGIVVQGDQLQVRNHSSTSNATSTVVTAYVGNVAVDYTVTTAGAGTRDWIPTDLGTKLKTWLRPEAFAGSAEAANLSTWTDASGNGNDFAGAGASGPPAVTATNGLNGFKAIYFTKNSGSYYKPATSPTTYTSGRTSTSTFFVCRNASVAATNGGPVSAWGSNADEYWPLASDGKLYLGYGATTRKSSITISPVDLTQWHVFGMVSAASDWRLHIDGNTTFSTTTNTVGNGTDPRIGYNLAIGTAFGGYLEEVVDCNTALTTTERQLVEGYLAWKYGLQANLPAGHPYLSAKPTV
jgi:lysophospholipase L1-like esterase